MLPSYLFHRPERNDYFYNPRAGAVQAQVCKRRVFKAHQLDEAVAYAHEQNLLQQKWSEEKKAAKNISGKSKIKDVFAAYLLSSDYLLLAKATREDYRGYLVKAEKLIVGLRTLFINTAIEDITAPTANKMYNKLVLDKGVYTANMLTAILRLVWNFAIRQGYIISNPFSAIKKKSEKKRKVMWKRKDVMSFLNVAFSKWEYRNVGIIFYMLYEWGQRPGDICKICWNQIDWENKSITIKQSKRGATVVLPISNGLLSILKQQKKDFLSHHYVAPRMRRVEAKWVPFSVENLNFYYSRIKKEAGLADELQMRDLRRTAITETIENGADLLTVMMLSGHTSVASISPYFVHTFKGSKKAQEVREFPETLYNQPIKKAEYADYVQN